MRPPRLVVDTNVVVSGLLSSDPQAPPVRILAGMPAGRIPFLISSDLLAEYREVLLRPKIQRLHGLSPSEVETVLGRLRQLGTESHPASTAGAAPDPGDAHIWALLAAHPEVVLVTGDHLLVDHPPEPGRVVSPRELSSFYPALLPSPKSGS